MENRKPFQVKSFLFLWNAGLAVFSIMGTLRIFEDVIHVVSEIGFHNSLCITNADRVRGFWVFAFMMSKFVELGDTFFLIVRKRNLMFLHWYHHVTVLLFTWYAVVAQSSTGRYFIAMNFLVHSLMYTYFALQTLNIKAPLFVSMTITTMQIMQMVGGIYVIVYTRMKLLSGEPCTQTFGVVNSGLIMYGSYFVLFVQFFVNAYITNRKQKTITTPLQKKEAPVSNETVIQNSIKNKKIQESLTEMTITTIMEHDLNSNHLKSL
jgi:elongation of very long chain fatty acids protein 6